MSIGSGLLLVLASLLGIVAFMVIWEKIVDWSLAAIGELYARITKRAP